MLILLDIDGVMVQGASWRKPEILNDGFFNFSPRATTSLQRVISETGASIVLTSSHKSSYNLAQWRKIFKLRGINAPIKRISTNSSSLNRKDEILNWLSKNPTINEFVIIDDDKCLNELPRHIKKKVVLTSSTVGLNNEHAESAINILTSKLE